MYDEIALEKLCDMADFAQGEEALQMRLELVRRYQEGIGTAVNLEEAEYWMQRAYAHERRETGAPSQSHAQEAESLEIWGFSQMSLRELNQARKNREPGGMYFYALRSEEAGYLDEAFRVYEETTEVVEKELEYIKNDPSRRSLMAMCRMGMGRIYSNSNYINKNAQKAVACMEEAVLELKYADGVLALIQQYMNHNLLENVWKILPILDTLSKGTDEEKKKAAGGYQALGRTAMCRVVLESAMSDDQEISLFTQENAKELPLRGVWKAVQEGNPWAEYEFSCRAVEMGDMATAFDLLLGLANRAEKNGGRIEYDWLYVDQAFLGNVYLGLGRGYQEWKQDAPNAFRCYQKAAEEYGNLSGYYSLYECYENGVGTQPDKEKALSCLERCTDSDDSLMLEKVMRALYSEGRKMQVIVLAQQILVLGENTFACTNAYLYLLNLKATDDSGNRITLEYLHTLAAGGKIAAYDALAWYYGSSVDYEKNPEIATWVCQAYGFIHAREPGILGPDRVKNWNKANDALTRYRNRLEAERLALERAEQERLEAERRRQEEERRRAEEERLARERAEQERLEAEHRRQEEERRRAEEERIALERAEQERLDAERRRQEEERRRAEEERLALERAEQEQLEAERLAQAQEKQDRRNRRRQRINALSRVILFVLVIWLGIGAVGVTKHLYESLFLDPVDVFADLEVKIVGGSPYGCVELQNNSIDPFIQGVTFQAEPSSGLSNGDTVTITAGFLDKDARKAGYRVEEKNMIYTVEGLNTYVTGVEQIDEAALSLMTGHASDMVEANVSQMAARDMANAVFDEYVYVSTGAKLKYESGSVRQSFFAAQKTQFEGDVHNVYVLIIEMPVQIHDVGMNREYFLKCDMKAYYAVCFENLSVNEDGELEVLLENTELLVDGSMEDIYLHYLSPLKENYMVYEVPQG